MYTAHHGESLIQLTRFTAFNVFLVRESDGFTLIDTGLKNSASAIIEAAKREGAPQNMPIRRIILTHAHVDHVGSLDALRELLPDAEVLISERDARFLRGDMSLDDDEPQSPLRGGYPQVSTTPDRLLKGGERIGSLEVIPTPGHTPGHIALFDHRDRTLIAGDAFSTRGGISTAGTFRLLFPFPALATWHKPLGLQSAETLYNLKPSRLATGHGKVLENPMPAMAGAIREAKQRVGDQAHSSQTAF